MNYPKSKEEWLFLGLCVIAGVSLTALGMAYGNTIELAIREPIVKEDVSEIKDEISDMNQKIEDNHLEQMQELTKIKCYVKGGDCLE